MCPESCFYGFTRVARNLVKFVVVLLRRLKKEKLKLVDAENRKFEPVQQTLATNAFQKKGAESLNCAINLSI